MQPDVNATAPIADIPQNISRSQFAALQIRICGVIVVQSGPPTQRPRSATTHSRMFLTIDQAVPAHTNFLLAPERILSENCAHPSPTRDAPHALSEVQQAAHALDEPHPGASPTSVSSPLMFSWHCTVCCAADRRCAAR